MVAASLGGTVWLLDAPGRIWPWFPVVFAVLCALLLVAVASEDGGPAVTQALVAGLLVGGAFWYAGEKFLALGYGALRWACWVAIGAHALNFAVRLLLAGRKKP